MVNSHACGYLNSNGGGGGLVVVVLSTRRRGNLAIKHDREGNRVNPILIFHSSYSIGVMNR